MNSELTSFVDFSLLIPHEADHHYSGRVLYMGFEKKSGLNSVLRKWVAYKKISLKKVGA